MIIELFIFPLRYGFMALNRFLIEGAVWIITEMI